jgi:hypothetical protein
MKTKLPLLAAMAALAVPLTATAQSAEPNNQPATAQTGLGFPIGEKSRIHTALDLGVAYDTNPQRFTSAEMTAAGVSGGDWNAVIRPGVNVVVPGKSASANLLGQLTINQYFGTGSNKSSTDVGALVTAAVSLGDSTAPVGFRLDDQFIRTPAFIDDLGSVAAAEIRFQQWFNRGAASVALRPGGGALEIDLGYFNQLSFFDNNFLGASQQHGGFLDARLRFLPRTAFVFHGDFSAFSPTDRTDSNGMLQHAGTQVSTPYNVYIGLIGQVTAHIATNLNVGFGDTLTWANGFFSTVSDDNRRTIIGTAELTYLLLESSRITVGYKRQALPIVVLSNYTSDMAYLRFLLGIGPRITFSAYGNFEWRSYASGNGNMMGGNMVPAGTVSGDQPAKFVTVDARVDYWFFEFLSAALDYRLLLQSAGNSNPNNILLGDYNRNQVILFVGLHY